MAQGRLVIESGRRAIFKVWPRRLALAALGAYNMQMKNNPDALVLFSGGLDSLLAAKILLEQGLSVLCLHFTSPFFGNAAKIPWWKENWGLNAAAHDISAEFCSMLVKGPEHGFGSTLNPCVDCKIMLLAKAKELMESYGAKFLATGEVLGQRPMSQRRESLNLIQKKAAVSEILLRPLCALRMEPTRMEESGLVKRDLMLGINGRGRNEQLALAERYGIKDIPTPAGGCLLTEIENGRRIWPIIKRLRAKNAGREEILADFNLSKAGRQFWLDEGFWLCVGRNRVDNQELMSLARPGDLTLKLCDYSGPIGLARGGAGWSGEALAQAARVLASYSREAKKARIIRLSVFDGGQKKIITAEAGETAFTLPEWVEARKEIAKSRCDE